MHDMNMKVKDILKRQINDVTMKGDITPSELCCLKDSYEILAKMSEIEAMEDYGYSGSRMMNGNSYGYPNSYPNSYDGMSMRRGRGADGRYVSRGDSMSHHSVNDRMIAALEMELDTAQSDFERQKIMDEIRRLREMKD